MFTHATLVGAPSVMPVEYGMVPPAPLQITFLRERAEWIRDRLDPIISREGPTVMNPNDVVELDELFKSLQVHPIHVDTVRLTRIHLALLQISGKATRWPSKLVEECDKVIAVLGSRVGPLDQIKPPIYDHGGRLENVCSINNLSKEAILKQWKRERPEIFVSQRPMANSALGLRSGAWWLNGAFAFYDGVINEATIDGGIVTDGRKSYAIVLKGQDEFAAPTFEEFTYQCQLGDKNVYKLMLPESRSAQPIRIFRSHVLSSAWAPRCGLRYDGLYRVRGWRLTPTLPAKTQGYSATWSIHFTRDKGQPSVDEILAHPNAAEQDDYHEFARIRKVMRKRLHELAAKTGTTTSKSSSVDVREILATPKLNTSTMAHEGDEIPTVSSKAAKILGINTPLGIHYATSSQAPKKDEQIQQLSEVGTFLTKFNESKDDPEARIVAGFKDMAHFQLPNDAVAVRRPPSRVRNSRQLRTDGTSEDVKVSLTKGLGSWLDGVEDKKCQSSWSVLMRNVSRSKDVGRDQMKDQIKRPSGFTTFSAEKQPKSHWMAQVVSPGGIVFTNPWARSQQLNHHEGQFSPQRIISPTQTPKHRG